MGGDVRVRDVVFDLKKRGMKVSSAQVSTLRKHAGSNGHAKTSARPLSLDHLLAAKKLAEQLGSIENAQAALASLARLTGG